MGAQSHVLALIPARGGSQRVPNKNIKLLGGKPLIAYTIEAAKRSKYITRVMVSTDFDAIADVARAAGAEVPFLRPTEIAGTHSTELELFDHVLGELERRGGYRPDLIVFLYPTAPFRTTASIDAAIEKILMHPEADSLRSVCSVGEHPYKMWTMHGDMLEPLIKTDDTNMHTWSYQSLPVMYKQNANIYIVRPNTVLEKRSAVGDSVVAFPMSKEESLDINFPEDFEAAEQRMRA